MQGSVRDQERGVGPLCMLTRWGQEKEEALEGGRERVIGRRCREATPKGRKSRKVREGQRSGKGNLGLQQWEVGSEKRLGFRARRLALGFWDSLGFGGTLALGLVDYLRGQHQGVALARVNFATNQGLDFDELGMVKKVTNSLVLGKWSQCSQGFAPKALEIMQVTKSLTQSSSKFRKSHVIWRKACDIPKTSVGGGLTSQEWPYKIIHGHQPVKHNMKRDEASLPKPNSFLKQ